MITKGTIRHGIACLLLGVAMGMVVSAQFMKGMGWEYTWMTIRFSLAEEPMDLKPLVWPMGIVLVVVMPWFVRAMKQSTALLWACRVVSVATAAETLRQCHENAGNSWNLELPAGGGCVLTGMIVSAVALFVVPGRKGEVCEGPES